MADLRKTLENMTKPELIRLVGDMLKVQPELSALVRPQKDPQHEEVIGQARRDLSRGYSIDSWIEKAERLHKADKHELAALLHQVVLEEILPILLEIEQECEITESLQVSVEGLMACVDDLKPGSSARTQALQALFAVIHWDTEQGGLGLSDAILPWMSDLNAEEVRLMRGWIESALASLIKGPSWEREHWGEVAQYLAGSDEDQVEFFRRHKIDGGHFKTLVERANFPAALQVAAGILKADEEKRVGLANALLEAGQLELARQLVREGPDRWRNWDWLASHYDKPKETAQAMECRLRCWALRQDMKTYHQIATLSKGLKSWPDQRKQLLSEVPPGWLRVEILTEEKAYAEAWDLADGLQGGREIVLDLAEKSAAQFPIRAAQAMLTMAQRRIESGKSRSAYREAGPWVKRALSYLDKVDLVEERKRIMEPWQEIYRRFSALQDEWQAMGLSKSILFP